MPLDTSSKRRSSVALLGSILAPPSPTDSPGVLGEADRQHMAWAYSGILAVLVSSGVMLARSDYLLRRQRGR